MTKDGATAGDTAAARFWNFSVTVYAAPRVERACLALQDGLGLDVNLLLFCCWSAAEGAPSLGGAAIARAVGTIRPWRDRAVGPLRDIRRNLKHPVEGLDDIRRETFRQRVAAMERESERITQELLVAATSVAPENNRTQDEKLAAGISNIADYLTLAGVDPAAEQRANLALILGVVLGFPPDRAKMDLEVAIQSRADGSAAL